MYGRDYGNRNFLDRAANTVRGWFGHRGGHDYDDGFRGGMRGGWDDDRGYREMGDVSGGYRGWQGGMEHGYGAAGWTGRNRDWSDRGGDFNPGGGWGRGAGEGYRTGGYNASHGAWDVDWDDDRTMPGGGMNRNGMMGRMSAGMMGSGTDRYDRGYAGRDFMTNQPAYDRHDAYRDDMEPGMRAGGMDRGMGMRGGMTGRGTSGGMQGGMNRGGMNRGYDRDMDWNRQGGGGMGPGSGMLGRDADTGDVGGGMIGNYGAYGNYGIERFRSGSAGGVPTGQYWTGYGHGSGYRG